MNGLIAMKGVESTDQLPQLNSAGLNIQAASSRDMLERCLGRPSSFDKIAVHCNLFADTYPWDWMVPLRQSDPGAKVMIALDRHVYDSLMLDVVLRLAGELDFSIVDAGMQDEEAVRTFSAFLAGSSNWAESGPRRAKRPGYGIIAAIWPAAGRDGSTTIAINAALALAASSTVSVGLIDGNLYSPDIRGNLNIPDRDRNSLRLRPKLHTKSLTPDELLGSCLAYRRIPGLHVLAGTPRRDTAADVTPEMVAHLLDVCRQTFDVTIVDLNGCPDNAATITAVRAADIRWLVAQPHYHSYRSGWSEWYECFWKYCGITPDSISLVVNRTLPETVPEQLAAMLGMQLAAAVPNVDGGRGLHAANEGVPLYTLQGAEKFAASMNRLAGILAAEAGAVALTEEAAPKQSGWSRLSAWLQAGRRVLDGKLE